jgi:hypothetical protein
LKLLLFIYSEIIFVIIVIIEGIIIILRDMRIRGSRGVRIQQVKSRRRGRISKRIGGSFNSSRWKGRWKRHNISKNNWLIYLLLLLIFSIVLFLSALEVFLCTILRTASTLLANWYPEDPEDPDVIKSSYEFYAM